jgi:hypothetical protein
VWHGLAGEKKERAESNQEPKEVEQETQRQPEPSLWSNGNGRGIWCRTFF